MCVALRKNLLPIQNFNLSLTKIQNSTKKKQERFEGMLKYIETEA